MSTKALPPKSCKYNNINALRAYTNRGLGYINLCSIDNTLFSRSAIKIYIKFCYTHNHCFCILFDICNRREPQMDA